MLLDSRALLRGCSVVLSHDWALIYRVSIVFNRVEAPAAVTGCQDGAQQTGMEGGFTAANTRA
jgi:hypothetical protein